MNELYEATELEEVLKNLRQISDEGVGWTHNQGFEWVTNTFIPHLEIAQHFLSDEKYLIADCFYVLGDIHDLNDAPQAAIEAYRQAIQYDEQFAAASCEMAGMYQKMGNYEQATKLISMAVNLAPEDEYAVSYQQ